MVLSFSDVFGCLDISTDFIASLSTQRVSMTEGIKRCAALFFGLGSGREAQKVHEDVLDVSIDMDHILPICIGLETFIVNLPA